MNWGCWFQSQFIKRVFQFLREQFLELDYWSLEFGDVSSKRVANKIKFVRYLFICFINNLRKYQTNTNARLKLGTFNAKIYDAKTKRGN